MAQHDMVIDNQAFPATRTDINNALLALATVQSGSTAPGTAYAGQLWLDTSVSPAVIRQRNSANTAWIALLAVDLSAGAFSRIANMTIPTATDTLVGRATTDTLTNKSLTSPTLTGTTLLSGSLNATGAAWMQIDTLTDGATITPDFSVGNNFSVTIAGNRTLANPSNVTAGQSGIIFVTQDATGGRTLAFGTLWDFTNGAAPTITANANAVDAIVWFARTTTALVSVHIPNVG